MQRKSPLMPPLSRFVPRMMVILPSTGRVPSVVVNPSPQCVQIVEVCFISHGRVLYRYGPEVSAPTGQISMHIPHSSSHSRYSSSLGTINWDELRLAIPNAQTSIPSPHTRTQ